MRFLVASCFILFSFLSCKSQPQKITNIKPSRVIAADSIPKPIGMVNDFEHLFSNTEITHLDSIIRQHQEKTTNQICIVTVDSSYTNKTDFNTFILQLHNTWGVGEKVKNNGVVIGISRQLRTIRINNGYGIEAIFTNENANDIIQKIMIPAFKKGDFFEGTAAGLQLVIHYLEK
ncbi:MAG: TPM domain-containing protein [Chitinophagaceae bacterium]|jgi:uncharacterized protein|nr:TPM domain-containing protein [Chitinophagaceae bacterium]